MAENHAEQDLEVDQGAYWSRQLSWTDDDGSVDVTGYTARMQVRKRIRDADPVLTLTSDDGDITLGGTALPQILIEISATATAALPATPTDRRWFYDLEMVPPGGQVRRLMSGRFIVSPEVTR